MTKLKQPSRQKPAKELACSLFPKHEWDYVGERRDGTAHIGLYKCSCGAKKEGLAWTR